MSVLQGRLLHSSAACRRAADRGLLSPSVALSNQPQYVLKHSTGRLRSKKSDDVEAVPVDPLLGALTGIGLSGTIAVAGSALCGYQLFSTFKWDQTPDLLLALQISGVIILVEALLFLPSYSIPASLTAASPSSSSSSSSSSGHKLQRQLVDMPAVQAAGVWSGDSWLLLLALYRAVLRRPQVEQLPQQARLGLLVARETSKELLLRGFVLTALARWVTDRCYEAGLDDSLALSPGGLELTLPQLGLCAASLAATALFAPAAFVAAEEAAESVSGALLLRTDVGQAVAAGSGGSSRGAAPATASTSGSINGSNEAAGSSSSSSTDAGRALTADDPRQAALAALLGDVQDSSQQQQQAATAAEQVSSDDGDSDDDDDELDPLVLEYRLYKVTEECVGSAAARIAYGLTLSKELARIMLANASFAVTGGNLAATWVAGLVTHGLVLVYAAVAAAGEQQQGAVDGSTPR
ncbi:hypothetical protein COO60DRAFT_703694 [Scenedesmus sp. NREL 46B-D3]|nr:hypothetical protein COO60DRAFT_703694 [Scenedesmus sp. NREL 46B-D3]